MAAQVIGAVPGRASRDERGSWRSRGMFDGSDDRQGAAALGALLNIDIEHPFGQPAPASCGPGREMGRITGIV